MWAVAFYVLSIAICIGLSAAFGAIGQGLAIQKALEGTARQPEASGKIMVILIIGLAFIESLVLYALVIAFQLLAGKGIVLEVLNKALR